MTAFDRWYATPLRQKLARPYVHLLFGARQTGKTTLLRSLLGPDALFLNLADPAERTRHLARPGEMAAMCRALPRRPEPHTIFVDEVQTVPSMLDAVQSLYDEDHGRWRFVLCGSSARKLRRAGANLLPGRSFIHHLCPVMLCEQPAAGRHPPGSQSPLALPVGPGFPENPFPPWDIEERLAWGALPGIIAAEPEDRVELLRAFTVVHLEEEIRREALIRDWGAFVRFLQFAALSSGQITNYAAISQETGVSQPTVKSHYLLLEDMFVGFPVPAYRRSPRRSLTSAPRFFFFDLGVRHAAAGLMPSPEVAKADAGRLFEQWVAIELWKRMQYSGGSLSHYRTRDGAEVDLILEHQGHLAPIEVKWTENPTRSDARHVISFLEESPAAGRGYVVCRCPRPLELHERVTAIPWQLL